MARGRSPNRDKAFELFRKANGDIKNREIASQLDISEKTVGGWKSKDKWLEKINGVLQSNKRSTPKKNGAPYGNQNGKGNKGGAPPKRNSNAVKHGLFAKYLPEETVEIMEAITDSDPADMLWDNIIIQYTAIIRSQKIMYVSDQEELSKEESSWSSGESSSSTTYALQYAWDKQANFLNAQSRAIGTLNNSIKQFVAITDEKDERRKKLELMTAQIRKADSEARILENTANKLTASGKANDLLQALLDVKSGGVVSGNQVQPEANTEHKSDDE